MRSGPNEEKIRKRKENHTLSQFKEGVTRQSSVYCIRITSTTMQTSTKHEHLTSLALIFGNHFLKPLHHEM